MKQIVKTISIITLLLALPLLSYSAGLEGRRLGQDKSFSELMERSFGDIVAQLNEEQSASEPAPSVNPVSGDSDVFKGLSACEVVDYMFIMMVRPVEQALNLLKPCVKAVSMRCGVQMSAEKRIFNNNTEGIQIVISGPVSENPVFENFQKSLASRNWTLLGYPVGVSMEYDFSGFYPVDVMFSRDGGTILVKGIIENAGRTGDAVIRYDGAIRSQTRGQFFVKIDGQDRGMSDNEVKGFKTLLEKLVKVENNPLNRGLKQLLTHTFEISKK